MKAIKNIMIAIIIIVSSFPLYGMESDSAFRGGNEGSANLPQFQQTSLLSKFVVAECIAIPILYAGLIHLGGRYLTEYNTRFTRHLLRNWINFPLPKPLKKMVEFFVSPSLIPLGQELSDDERKKVEEMLAIINTKTNWNISDLYLLQEPTTSLRCDSITVDTFAFSPDFFTGLTEDEQMLNLAYLCATIKDKPKNSDHHKVTHAAFVSAVVGLMLSLCFSKMLKENFPFIKNSFLGKGIALPGLTSLLTTSIFLHYARLKAAASYGEAAVACDFADGMVELLRSQIKYQPKTFITSCISLAHSVFHTCFGLEPSAQEMLMGIRKAQKKYPL